MLKLALLGFLFAAFGWPGVVIGVIAFMTGAFFLSRWIYNGG